MNLYENGTDSLKKSIKIFNEINNEYFSKNKYKQKNIYKNQYQEDFFDKIKEENLLEGKEFELLKNREYKLKDLIINLHHSIETMFKYMIQQKNEYLIFENCEEIFKAKATSTFKDEKKVELKTIQFLDAIHRVIVLYDIQITQLDYNKFVLLNKMRNALTHYEKEFTDNEVEHLVALLIPILLKIYKDNIFDFESWAKKNEIYSTINNCINKNDLWLLEKHYDFKTRWNECQNEWSCLETTNKSKIEKLFKNKNKLITYLECPVCGKELFIPTGAYIINLEEYLYLGKCKCCNIDIKKEDAEFIALNYGKYDNYDLNKIDHIKNAIENLLFSNNLNFDEIRDIIKQIIETIYINKEIFIDDFKKNLIYLIKDICEIIEKEAFNFSMDEFSDIVIYDNSIKNLKMHDLIDKIKDKKMCLKKLSIVERVIDIFDYIDKELNKGKNNSLCKEIITALNNEIYTVYYKSAFLDCNGNEEEKTIEINMEFNYKNIYELYLKDKID